MYSVISSNINLTVQCFPAVQENSRQLSEAGMQSISSTGSNCAQRQRFKGLCVFVIKYKDAVNGKCILIMLSAHSKTFLYFTPPISHLPPLPSPPPPHPRCKLHRFKRYKPRAYNRYFTV